MTNKHALLSCTCPTCQAGQTYHVTTPAAPSCSCSHCEVEREHANLAADIRADIAREADVPLTDHDALARHLLTVAIERRHFSGAVLTQMAVDLFKHCLAALEDRTALASENSRIRKAAMNAQILADERRAEIERLTADLAQLTHDAAAECGRLRAEVEIAYKSRDEAVERANQANQSGSARRS